MVIVIIDALYLPRHVKVTFFFMMELLFIYLFLEIFLTMKLGI